MGQHPEPPATPKQLQVIAHARGRICKVRGCERCAPLRERRRLKKAQRKAEAQALLHAQGAPCGRNHCPVPACVTARHADGAVLAVAEQPAAPHVDPGEPERRQGDRHRAGLPCGFESCPREECIAGFAQERVRRHRAGRPCRAGDCTNPICVTGRQPA